MPFIYIFIFGLCSFAFGQTSDAKLEDLNRRIEELEKNQQELLLQAPSNRNQVNSFLKDSLTIGGFTEIAMTGMEGPDTNLQVMNSSNVLGLNIAADFTDRLHFVSQFITGLVYPIYNPQANPNATPTERKFGAPFIGSLLTQSYIEYTYSKKLRIQGGMGYVPFGQALQLRELVLFYRRGGPQLLRTTELVSPLWGGIHLLGDFTRKNGGEWGYNLYTTNPINSDKTHILGIGGRTWISTPDDKAIAGFSFQAGKYNNDFDHVLGTDLKLRFDDYMITTEYARHVASGKDPWTAYIEPAMYFNEESWLGFVFADYAENPLSTYNVGATPTSDPYKKWEYGAGLNWFPTSYTRLRLTYTWHDYVGSTAIVGSQNRDYHSLDLSAGVAF
jgi:hypothetical protein